MIPQIMNENYIGLQENHIVNDKLKQKEHRSDRQIPIKNWNSSQLRTLANTVLKERGFISTEGESMKHKWRRISIYLQSTSEFSTLHVPQWDGLYKAYKEFRRDLLRYYDVDPITVDTRHLKVDKIKDWIALIITMEKYRAISNHVSIY